MADDCVFCKIARGDILVKTLMTGFITAFHSNVPVAPVHVVVVMSNHHENLSDPDLNDEGLRALLPACRKVAEEMGIDKTGYRVVINNGADAGQTVKHLHAHVLGGGKLGGIG